MKRFENVIWILNEEKKKLKTERKEFLADPRRQPSTPLGRIWKIDDEVNEIEEAIDKLKEY